MRINEFGESDLLVTFFTRDRGRLKGVAKGARRSRQRFVNCLDIFCLVDLEYRLKQRSGLHFLHSGRLIDAYPGLRTDFTTMSKACYMIELTEILFPWELADIHMFEILKRSLHILTRREKTDQVTVVFEIMAMNLGGYSINLEKCCICGRTYTGEGTAAFRPDRGGIACLGCQRITALSPKMGPDTIKAMRLIQSRVPAQFEKLTLSHEIMSEVGPALKLHREYHLEQSPKTACYLD